MKTRTLLLSIVLLFALAIRAQQPMQRKPPTPLTEALLMSQKPQGVTEEQWRELIRKPTTAALYPIRLTQAMLDTLDVKQLDIRYQYVLVPERQRRNDKPLSGQMER